MTPRWTHEPLEESLGAARTLTVSVMDRAARDGWEPMAQWAGIPRRRWRRHHPLGAGRDRQLVAIVDGRPAFDAAAWERFASLVPGAVALPRRTAAAYGVAPGALRPPGRAPWRMVDLWRARRAGRRLRKAERTLDAEVARVGAQLAWQVSATLADGEDGTPVERLPTYALAARLVELMRWDGAREVTALVDLASSNVMGRLLHALVERGMAPGGALLATAQLSAGAAIETPAWLEPGEASAGVDAWLAEHGWHSLGGLQLEAEPLHADPAGVERWLASVAAGDADGADSAGGDAAVDPQTFGIEPDSVLADVVERVRRLTALREVVGQQRLLLHAALRALAWSIGAQLVRERRIEMLDVVFDLTLDELVLVARGGDVPDVHARQLPQPDADAAPAVSGAMPVAQAADGSASLELRGIPAGAGVVEGRLVVLDAPTIDEDVAGALLVCRLTDPGWMPLIMRSAGIVTERGGPLSHAAVVARELGIPAVVGVADARALVRGSGARSGRLDGGAGTLHLHG